MLIYDDIEYVIQKERKINYSASAAPRNSSLQERRGRRDVREVGPGGATMSGLERREGRVRECPRAPPPAAPAGLGVDDCSLKFDGDGTFFSQ